MFKLEEALEVMQSYADPEKNTDFPLCQVDTIDEKSEVLWK